jgi:hypothetical protein
LRRSKRVLLRGFCYVEEILYDTPKQDPFRDLQSPERLR